MLSPLTQGRAEPSGVDRHAGLTPHDVEQDPDASIRCHLKATLPEQRTNTPPPKPNEAKGDPLEQIVKLEWEINQVQEKYKRAEANYGSELLNLVVAKGYLTRVLETEAVRAYVVPNAPEILEQFELVINTISMEEALERAERKGSEGEVVPNKIEG